MKKILSIVLVLVMLTFAGCANDAGSGTNPTDAAGDNKAPVATKQPEAGLTDGDADEGKEEDVQSPSMTEGELSSNDAQAEVSYKVTLIQEGNTIFDETLAAKSGQSLLDVMKEHLKIEEKDGFVTAMQDVVTDETAQKYWLFTINDDFVTTGAAETFPVEGDSVVWKYEALS